MTLAFTLASIAMSLRPMVQKRGTHETENAQGRDIHSIELMLADGVSEERLVRQQVAKQMQGGPQRHCRDPGHRATRAARGGEGDGDIEADGDKQDAPLADKQTTAQSGNTRNYQLSKPGIKHVVLMMASAALAFAGYTWEYRKNGIGLAASHKSVAVMCHIYAGYAVLTVLAVQRFCPNRRSRNVTIKVEQQN